MPAVTFWETHRAKMGARNDKGMMGDIFYGYSVVGNNIYSIYTKMGGRTHSAVPLQCVHEHIRLYKKINYMNVQVIIYV